MIGEHPGKAGGIGANARGGRRWTTSSIPGRKWGEILADICLVLRPVFQPCWHILY